MGLTGRWLWVSSYSKKQWRSLFWRVRAAVNKAVNSNGAGRRGRKGGYKQHHKFQYDPSSYALNFDDGCKGLGEETINIAHRSNGFQLINLQDHFHSIPNTIVTTTTTTTTATTWIYVFWVKI